MYRVPNWGVRVRENLQIFFFQSAWTGEGGRKNNSKFTDPNPAISNSDYVTFRIRSYPVCMLHQFKAFAISHTQNGNLGCCLILASENDDILTSNYQLGVLGYLRDPYRTLEPLIQLQVTNYTQSDIFPQAIHQCFQISHSLFLRVSFEGMRK